jgi:hypothetical protein
MKSLFLVCSFLLALGVFGQAKLSDSFYLDYSYAGLGSNTGVPSLGARIEGTTFKLFQQQNSCYEGQSTPEGLIYEAELSQDAILELGLLFTEVSDTSIYESNVSIMSGGVYTLVMRDDTKSFKMSLHNTSHRWAERLVLILNPEIPADLDKKLWSFNSGR